MHGIYSLTQSLHRGQHKSFVINADCVITWMMNTYFVSCPDFCHDFLSLSPYSERLNAGSHCWVRPLTQSSTSLECVPRKKQQGALSSLCLKWLEMASNGISMEPDIALYPYPLPGTGQGPFYARVILNDAFSVFDSRQPSSVWKNTRILQPLASGWLLLRTTVRSKALSLTESWSAAAITSSLISHWSHFQVRPVQSPGFWE